MKDKRYEVAISFYIYVENDEKAKEEAEFFRQHIDSIEDGKAKIEWLKESKFGNMKTRKIK